MINKINPKGFLFDLDGVLFIDKHVIPGAIETINYLKEKNYPCRFLTNTTSLSFDSLYQKFHDLKLPIENHELFSPPKIATQYLSNEGNPSVCLILGDDTRSQFSAFRENNKNPDYVVLGDYEDKWDYALMQRLFNMVMNGSKILALHKGRYWKTDAGLSLDIGAFVVGLEHATSSKAIVVGKPSATFFEIALGDMGVQATDAVMIGDDLINDIEGSQALGIKAILVKTGKYREDQLKSSGITPDLIIDSVKDLPNLI